MNTTVVQTVNGRVPTGAGLERRRLAELRRRDLVAECDAAGIFTVDDRAEAMRVLLMAHWASKQPSGEVT